MRCSHCNAEIEKDSIYCKKCGRELQIVPDYDPMDEWVVGQAHLSKAEKKKEKQNTTPVKETEEDVPEKKEKPAVLWRWAALSCLLLVCFAAFLIAYFSMRKENSYEYQLKKGCSLLEEEQYEEAISYLKQAQSFSGDLEEDILPLRYLAWAYVEVECPELAVSCMKKAIDLEEEIHGDSYTLEELYLEYMEILNQARQTDLIAEVIESCKYEGIRQLLLPYRIEKPSSDTPEGTYSRFLRVELEAEYGAIYYTLDGTEPTAESTRYEGYLDLQEEGEVLMSAVAINKQGMISDKLVLVYKLEFNNEYGQDD